jgi:hypothetical protein
MAGMATSDRPRAVVVAFLGVFAGLCACGSSNALGGTAAPGSTSPAAPSAPAPKRTTSCLDAPGVMINDALLPGFTPYIPVSLTPFPFTGMAPGPVYVVDFVRGYMHGFLIDAALTGRYRAENDARTRAGNGTVQQWPIVPLSGSIVHEIPGPLEVYEWLWDFGVPSAAQAWLTDRKQNQIMSQYPQIMSPAAAPPGFVVYRHVLITYPSDDEHAVTAFGVRGSIGLTLTVQGGDHLSWADARPLVTAAESALSASCPKS